MKRFSAILALLLLFSLLTSCMEIPEDPSSSTACVHAWSEWQVATSATCLEAGEQFRICDCGETQTAPIPALQNHVAGDWEIITPATKTQDGMQIKQCIYCNTFLEHAIIPAWGSDEVSKTTCTITLKTTGGSVLSGIPLYIYADEALTILLTEGRTNASGTASIELPVNQSCWLVLENRALEGYQCDASYPLDLSSNNIIALTSSVILDQNVGGLYYELGDIMHDFTVTDCDGNEFTLSEVLKTKEMVLINFWYTTCSWCVKEFPYMQSVYEDYSDRVAIIALDPYPSDSEEMIKAFRDEMGLTFPMAKDYTSLTAAFSDYIEGYPTSVIVDRYGMICAIECGGIVSEEPFRALFDHFTGEDYTQTILRDIDEILTSPTASVPTTDKRRAYKK